MPFLLATALVVLGAVFRIAPHPPNFVALGALAIYAGARLPIGWAFLVPLGALALSDLAFGWAYGFSGFGLVQGTGYATFAFIALLSGLMTRNEGPPLRIFQSVGASTLFFLLSNLAVWASPLLQTGGNPALYPTNAVGLLACYTAALPFFANGLLADLLGVGLLFGGEAMGRRALATLGERQVLPMWLTVRDGRRRG
jgi:hypothetical protein